MFKSFCSLISENILAIIVVILCIESVRLVAIFVNDSLSYLHIVYVLLGIIGVIFGFMQHAVGKWLLMLFFGLQIIFIKTLDFEFGYDAAIGFPLAVNSNSTTNGQLTELLILKINLLAFFLFCMTRKFYESIEQKDESVASNAVDSQEKNKREE